MPFHLRLLPHLVPIGSLLRAPLLLLLIAFAQAQTPAPTSSATVAGRVVLRGEPARGVTVALYNVVSGLQRTRTDATGHFAFSGLATGAYAVTAFAPGFVVPADSLGQPGVQLNVAAESTIDDVLLELKPGGVITGRVKDEHGRPLTGQAVRLRLLDANGKPQQYQSSWGLWGTDVIDDRGVYRIYGLPEGRYLVFVGTEVQQGTLHLYEGGAYRAAVFYPDAPDEARAKPVAVGEGAVVEGIDLTVGDAKRTFRVAGRVRDAETGRPVSGVTLTIASVRDENEQMGGYGARDEKTDAAGEFVLADLPPGRYQISAGSVVDSSEWISEPVTCEVRDEDVEGVVLNATRGASLRGAVVFDVNTPPALRVPPETLSLLAMREGGNNPRTSARLAKIDAAGNFAVQGLTEGKINLRVVGMTIVKGLSLLRVERNGSPLPDDSINVARGERVNGLRLVVTVGSGVVRGQVRVVGGSLPPGLDWFVYAESLDGHLTEGDNAAPVDVRGQFLLEGLLPGHYRLGLRLKAAPLRPTAVPKAVLERLEALVKTISAEVTVSSDAAATATLTLDLSQAGGKQ